MSAPSMEACEQGLDDYFVEGQRVDGVVPWHLLVILS